MADDNRVVVVGSGAGGGMMAHTLTAAGINVLLLEAGRRWDPETDAAMFQLPKEAPLRGEGTPDKNDGYFDANIGGFEMPGQPYTYSKEQFRWWRSRQLGGRTHHFGRQTPRYGPEDFKMFSMTGREVDWPFSYEDIEPYYDRVEAIMGIFGPDADEAVYNSPLPPNHIRQKPPAPRASEMLFEKALKKMGIKTMAHPTAILTSPLNGRQACFYATNCIRGCSIGAAFDSVTAYIKPAEETGKLQILYNTIAYQVLIDDSGKKATGLRYIDTETGENKELSAKVIVLAPGAMESSRILLNSKSDVNPSGVANSSGMVGKYISDTLFTSLWIHIPELDYAPAHNEDGISQPHVYAPWWLHGEEKEKAGADFSSGYKIEVDPYRGGRFGPPSMNATFRIMLHGQKGLYGAKLKDHMRRYYGSLVGIRTLGGMSVNENCYLTINPDVKDKWGIPVPDFHWQWSDEDFRRGEHMNKTLHELAKNMGATVIYDAWEKSRQAGRVMEIGGEVNHEIGGCRMGDDPKTSVLNEFSQTWDVDNLYIADGAPFATHVEKNPTLTIMAMAMRAADNIIDRLKGGEL
jgi:choline dehydrogenase-like flavoprotein